MHLAEFAAGLFFLLALAWWFCSAARERKRILEAEVGIVSPLAGKAESGFRILPLEGELATLKVTQFYGLSSETFDLTLRLDALKQFAGLLQSDTPGTVQESGWISRSRIDLHEDRSAKVLNFHSAGWSGSVRLSWQDAKKLGNAVEKMVEVAQIENRRIARMSPNKSLKADT